MRDRTGVEDPATTSLERLLGAYQGEAGALVICVAGVHGNEPSGVPAARRVLAELERRRPPFRGRFVALAGNLTALSRGVRYVDVDLNRQWIPERVRAILAAEGEGPAEDEELRQLLAALESEVAGAAEPPAYFLDLHTSSAEGPPFATVGDTMRNRAFALRLGLPIVLGLEEQIDGALLEYVNNRGHVTVGIEGGRHGSGAASAHHEAVLWLALLAAGCLRPEDLPEAGSPLRRLFGATAGVPRVVEVRHRHVVRPGDGFRMKTGLRNFDRIEKGELLAEDRSGPIRAAEDGRVLLPLYQGQGADGFFTVRDVRPAWLLLSNALRRAGAPRLARWLPGVRRHPWDPDTLLVDTRVARFFPLQVFHLLGFRKRRWQGNLLLVTRRRHDHPPRS